MSSPEAKTPALAVVRPARPDELGTVGELTLAAYRADGEVGAAYAEALRNAADRDRHTELLVAADPTSGALLGTVAFVRFGGPYAQLADSPREAEFRMLAVAPAACRRGVGELLVRACVQRARSAGALRLVLSTEPQMTAAHRMYARLGFRPAPHRDWAPWPGLVLRVYELDLDTAARNGPRSTSARTT